MRPAPIFSLRVILTAAFLMAALLPLVAFLILSPLVGQGRDDSGSHHLREARSLASRLHAYHNDLVGTFASLGPMIAEGRANALENKLDSLHVTQVCAVHPATGVVFQNPYERDDPCPTQFSQATLDRLKALSAQSWVGVSPVQRPEGRAPHLLMATRSYDVLVTAKVGLGFFRDLQGDVSFGDGGHAAIVDGQGRVLAHPLAAMANPPADIGDLPPIRAALGGDSTVLHYRSAELDTEMLAGFAPVAGAGWAVMVTQPLEGLTAPGSGQWILALLTLLVGVALACFAAAVLSKNVGMQIRAAADPHVAASDLAGAKLPRVRELLHLGGFVQRKIEQAEAAEAVETDLRRTADQAKEVRDAFVHNIREEIVAPMAGIVAGMDALRKTTPAHQRRPEHDMLFDNAAQMQALLSDLADLSRLGAGRINLTSAPFNLRETVLSIARLLRPQANEKGLDLFVRVPPGLPETLVGDAGRVRQLLIHLVGNALRFTEAGHVYIDLQIAQISQDIRSIQLSVSDTGPGFSTEELDRIFDAFEQCDGTDLGARLGLEICSQITNAMEGGLTVESELGQGSVFRFSVRLPVASTAQEQPGLDTSALAGVRVMVAASHPVQRRILVDYLNAFGVTTYEDTSAEQMITLLSGPAKADETVDFILCDPKGRPDLPKMIDAQFASQPQERTPQFFVLAEPGAALPHLPHGAQTVATPVTPNALCYALLKSLGKREADQSNPDPKEESVPEVVDVAPKHAANDGPAVAASQRVLVIEPDLNARSSIEIILDKVDLSAAFVADAHAARSYLDKDQGFDALLIHLDGSETKDHPSFHFLHDLREVSEDRRRTIVGMIGPATRSVSRALVAQGLTHVIRKPVSADALSRILLSSRDETSPTAQSAPGDDRSAQTIKRAAG